jgi:hypothetical protein
MLSRERIWSHRWNMNQVMTDIMNSIYLVYWMSWHRPTWFERKKYSKFHVIKKSIWYSSLCKKISTWQCPDQKFVLVSLTFELWLSKDLWQWNCSLSEIYLTYKIFHEMALPPVLCVIILTIFFYIWDHEPSPEPSEYWTCILTARLPLPLIFKIKTIKIYQYNNLKMVTDHTPGTQCT